MKIDGYLHLYIGCTTNLGELVGVNENSYLIRLKNNEVVMKNFNEQPPLKLFLRKISDLNVEESTELNKKGLSIGRPRGYSFSPEAILYLLSLRIDLFNLITNGLAIDLSQ